MAAKVLVVDDEKMIVKGLRFSLMQEGYEVECAYDGEEAVNMIRDTRFDIVLGLDYGADDYVTKPFNPLEVKGRIKAIIRRTSRSRSTETGSEKLIEVGDLRMDLDNQRVTLSGKEINLTSKEFELLELLATHAGKVYSRATLLQMVWGKDYPGDVRTVDVHIRRLREKIEHNASEPRYVQTKWGVGYYFRSHER